MRTMKIIHTVLLLCLALVLQPAWSEGSSDSDTPPPQTIGKPLPPADLEDGGLASLRIGNRRIRVEVASTPQSRERGLMQRAYLCDDCGMLFVFEKADKYSFWMKDTPLPLSIAFIAADGSILNIEEMLPNTLDSHNSQGEALYALEMNGGWFARNSIAPAAKVQGLKRVPKAQ